MSQSVGGMPRWSGARGVTAAAALLAPLAVSAGAASGCMPADWCDLYRSDSVECADRGFLGSSGVFIPWVDKYGDGCASYEANGYCAESGWNTFGMGVNALLTANAACCACGGGRTVGDFHPGGPGEVGNSSATCGGGNSATCLSPPGNCNGAVRNAAGDDNDADDDVADPQSSGNRPEGCPLLVSVPQIADSNLTSIDLANNAITTIDLGAFSGLAFLSELDMQNNQLTALRAGMFSGLTSLRSLNLNNNMISVIANSSFEGLASLTTLTLKTNRVSRLGPGAFTGLTELRYVNVDDNVLETIGDAAFAQLVMLETLYLKTNRLSRVGSAMLEGLQNLTTLRLNDNRITELEPGSFSEVARLEKLYIYDNYLSSIEPHTFWGLESLTVLSLHDNNITSVSNSPFASLGQLKTLFLQHNKISSVSNSSFASLGQLKTLYLHYNDITSVPNSLFASLGQLEKLYLHDNAISIVDAGAMEGLVRVEDVSLSRNRITYVASGAFSTLSMLEQLYLYENSLTFISRGAFEGVSRLKTLHLYGNHLAFLDSDVFSTNVALETLRLDDNQLTRISDGAFGSLGALDELHLEDNALSEIGTQTFRGATSLTYLNLNDNTISSCEDGSFMELVNLGVLHLMRNNLTRITESMFIGLASLTFLNPNYNLITVIEDGAFSQVNRLATLYLNSNELTWITAGAFDGLRSLTDLCLYNNRISGIALGAFSGLSHLQKLYLYRNSITWIRAGHFDGLSSLEVLSLGHNGILGVENQSFSDLGALENLVLTYNSISWLGTEILTGLTSLKLLRLASNSITGIEGGFVDVAHLTELYLAQNRLRALSGGMFLGMRRLSWLDLNNNSVTYIEDSAFYDTSRLQELDLGANEMTTVTGGALLHLTRLSKLNLERNYITRIETAAFSDLHKLIWLGLYSNRLSQLNSEMLGGLRRLVRLNLAKNNITTIADLTFVDPHSIPFSSLRYLDLTDNRISEITGATFLGTMLCTFDISGNSITSLSPDAFTMMPVAGNSRYTLDLHGQGLTEVLPGTFTWLYQMATIDLSDNYITAVHAGAFSPALERLLLFGNRNLLYLHPGAFPVTLPTLVMTFPPDRSASACSVGVNVYAPLQTQVTCVCAEASGTSIPMLRGGDLGYCTSDLANDVFLSATSTPPAPTFSSLVREAPQNSTICLDGLSISGDPWLDEAGHGCSWYNEARCSRDAEKLSMCSDYAYTLGNISDGARFKCCVCGGGIFYNPPDEPEYDATLLSPKSFVINESYFLPAVFGLDPNESSWELTVRADPMLHYYKNFTGSGEVAQLGEEGYNTEDMSYGWPARKYWSGEGSGKITSEGMPPGIYQLIFGPEVLSAIDFYHSSLFCPWDDLFGIGAPNSLNFFGTSNSICPVPVRRTDGLRLEITFGQLNASRTASVWSNASIIVHGFPQRFAIPPAASVPFVDQTPVNITAGFSYQDQNEPLPRKDQIIPVRGFGTVPVDVAYGFESPGTDRRLLMDPYRDDPFRVDPGTGILLGRLPANITPGLYQVAIGARDKSSDISFTFDGSTNIAAFALNVSAALNVQGSAVNSTVGIPFFGPKQRVSGGLGGVIFAVKAGSSLPSGLMVDHRTGQVHGVPLESGDTEVQIIATDENGAFIELPSLKVSVLETATLVWPELAPGVLGKPYRPSSDDTIWGPQATGGGEIAMYANVSVLPPGLSLNPATGELYGTPREAGNFVLHLVAISAQNQVVNVIDPEGGNVSVAIAACGDQFTCSGHGTCSDGGATQCFCESGWETSPFSGTIECDVPSDSGAAVGGVIVGILLVVVITGWFVLRHRAMRAHDFRLELLKMIEAGEIDANTAVDNMVPREIARANITLTSELGKGKFGQVYKAVLTDAAIRGQFLVAVKTVKEGSPSEYHDALLAEAVLMAQIPDHPHLVSLIGTVTRGDPKLLLVSYCDGGSLLTLLKRAAEHGGMPEAERLRVGRDVCAGMEHLSLHRMVHRDLAARNVLVDSLGAYRVADFGLSRASRPKQEGADEDLSSVYYRTADGELPVHWTAVESLETGVSTPASDVWSFAVLMIEVYTDGMRPFSDKITDTEQVYFHILAGGVPEKPDMCSAGVYSALCDCWNRAPKSRPHFAELGIFFCSLLESMGEKASDSDAHGCSDSDAHILTEIAANDQVVGSHDPEITAYQQVLFGGNDPEVVAYRQVAGAHDPKIADFQGGEEAANDPEVVAYRQVAGTRDPKIAALQRGDEAANDPEVAAYRRVEGMYNPEAVAHQEVVVDACDPEAVAYRQVVVESPGEADACMGAIGGDPGSRAYRQINHSSITDASLALYLRWRKMKESGSLRVSLPRGVPESAGPEVTRSTEALPWRFANLRRARNPTHANPVFSETDYSGETDEGGNIFGMIQRHESQTPFLSDEAESHA